MNFDVFISYHTKSSAHITEAVCNALENKKIKCWYAPRNISGSYARSIVEAINKCKVFLLILNKESSYSEDVLNEINLAVERVRKGEDISIIPFHTSEEDISDDAKYYLGRIHWVDAITPPLEKRINELTSRISYILNKNSNQETKDDKQTLKSNYSATINNFVGRRGELRQIKENLNKYGKVFVEGMGGIGKSELIKAFINENINEFNKIIFAIYEDNLINTITKETYFKITDFFRKTDEHGNPENLEIYFQRKLDKINELTDEKTLIIIDNFDTESDNNLKDLLKGNYKIIFTTRNDFSSYKLPVIHIGPLENKQDLIEIFKNSYQLPINSEEENTIFQIINLIGKHTLTINLIASAMNESRIKPQKMLENLKAKNINISTNITHNLENYDTLYNCLHNIFNLSNLTEEEKHILKLLNLFPLKGISFEDFMNLCELDDGLTVNKLIKKSIITYNVVNDYISLHPLISSLIDKEMTISLKEAKPLIKNVAKKYAWNITLETVEKYAPICLNLYTKFKDFDVTEALDFISLSNFILATNNWTVTENILSTAVNLFEQDKQNYIDELIIAYGSIGYLYSVKEKNFFENRKYIQKTIDLTKDNPKYYKNHGDALRAMADLYLADKEYSKAKEYIEKSYIYLNKDATTPDNFWGSYYYVSSKIYKALKEYDKAIIDADKCYKYLFGLYKKENLDVSAAYKLKGEINLEQGNTQKAINLLEKALEIRLKYRSDNNSTVLEVKESLAMSYFKNKNYSKALEIYENIYQIIKDNFCNTDKWLEDIKNNINNCKKKM